MMMDDSLYGLLDIAYELRVSIDDLLDMPMMHIVTWLAYFQRRNAERQVRRR
jgi:hypothetical protein